MKEEEERGQLEGGEGDLPHQKPFYLEGKEEKSLLLWKAFNFYKELAFSFDIFSTTRMLVEKRRMPRA